MGLSVTHGCFSSPYSTFQEWRCVVAKAAGYKLEDLGFTSVPKISPHWLTTEHEFGEWKKTPKDPLIVLFSHSDCEGVIHPEQGIPLADRMEELLDLIPSSYYLDYREMTKNFISGLRLAASRGEDVEFL